jgi:hypothetical protein
LWCLEITSMRGFPISPKPITMTLPLVLIRSLLSHNELLLTKSGQNRQATSDMDFVNRRTFL